MTTDDEASRTKGARRTSPLYSAVVGLAGLAVLLQGVWAGLFVKEGQEYTRNWVEIHARGADVAIALAVIATIIAFVQLRSRRDVVIGSIVFVLLLILEAYLGGLIGKSPGVTVIHFPLALAMMALAVWLPLRAARR